MLACFALTWMTNDKPFNALQFVSQMLGIGLLTHPAGLINVPTWFISVILACYLLILVAKLTTRPVVVDLVLIALIMVWASEVDLSGSWMHFLTFFVASALTNVFPPNQRVAGFTGTGMSLLLLTPWSIAFTYTGLTLVAIGAALCVSEVPQFVGRLANLSYEYYLFHGFF